MDPYEDPLARMGGALVCALLAQIANVMAAALLASTLPGDYRVRSLAFLGGVMWTLAGTILLVVQTSRAGARSQGAGVRAGRVALWFVSAWVWPILVHWRKRA